MGGSFGSVTLSGPNIEQPICKLFWLVTIYYSLIRNKNFLGYNKDIRISFIIPVIVLYRKQHLGIKIIALPL
jgi:hypothetical protein